MGFRLRVNSWRFNLSFSVGFCVGRLAGSSIQQELECICGVYAFVRVCVRACVRACVWCVCVCLCLSLSLSLSLSVSVSVTVSLLLLTACSSGKSVGRSLGRRSAAANTFKRPELVKTHTHTHHVASTKGFRVQSLLVSTSFVTNSLQVQALPHAFRTPENWRSPKVLPRAINPHPAWKHRVQPAPTPIGFDRTHQQVDLSGLRPRQFPKES